MPSRDESFWHDRPVFITGGSGFLGGWLVRELIDQGAVVVCLIRDRVPASMLFREGLHDAVITVQGDLSDAALLRRTLSEYDIKTVFHLAAQAIVGVAKKDPVGTLETNVRGTWSLLEASRQAGVEQIVVASSDKAYGLSNTLPYLETHPLQGQYPYDVSKSCADLICRMYAKTYDLPVGITRCGNIFGGGDLNFSRTIPGAIQATLQGERFVIRSDGHYVRDFIFVKDAVHGYLCLAERLAESKDIVGEAFNFSLELRLTVLEIVRTILEKMERTDLDPIIQNIASGEIREQYMEAGKARRLLGWKPRYGMDGGLDETIEWYRSFFSARAPERPQLSATRP